MDYYGKIGFRPTWNYQQFCQKENGNFGELLVVQEGILFMASQPTPM